MRIILDSLSAIVLLNSNCKFHYRGMRLVFPSTTRTVSREEITSVVLCTTVKMIPLNGSILWLPSIPSYCNMHEPLETVIFLLESFDCILLINGEQRAQLNSLDCSVLNFITGQILHKAPWAFQNRQTQIKKWDILIFFFM